MAVRARWLVLGAYVGAIYGTLPYGPGIGRMVMRSRPGGWLLGSGMGIVAAVAAAGIVALLVRRGAPRAAYVALGALVLSAIRARRPAPVSDVSSGRRSPQAAGSSSR